MVQSPTLIKVKLNSPWQKKRTQLNHDWLQNSFLLSISKLINIRKGIVEDGYYSIRFYNDILPEWKPKSAMIRSLINEFPMEMSPAKFFHEAPMGFLEADLRSVFEEITDELWRSKFAVDHLVGDALHCLEIADNAFQECLVSQDSSHHTQKLEAFQIACIELSESLSAFPSKITY